jgi:antagonist of KipI
MSIRIIEQGISDTIQDKGRFGYSDSGINFNGVMDPVAACVANYLVGNNENDAVMEVHFPAPVMLFDNPVMIAITGGDFSPVINDTPVPCNTAIMVPAASVLRFTKIKWGARACLSVKGGFDLPRWLDSFSTNLKAKAGGMEGRTLKKGDIINLNTRLSFGEGTGVRSLSEKNIKPLPWHADITPVYTTGNIIRTIKGGEYIHLTECSETILDGNTFTISPQSDRMGFRLNGSPLQSKEQQQMISSAVTNGTVQLLPNGQLIILMADHQTTGGYPKIAHVISADIPKLAQMQINTSLRFQFVSVEDAEALLLEQHHHLQQLKNACTFRIEEFFKDVVHRS